MAKVQPLDGKVGGHESANPSSSTAVEPYQHRSTLSKPGPS